MMGEKEFLLFGSKFAGFRGYQVRDEGDCGERGDHGPAAKRAGSFCL